MYGCHIVLVSWTSHTDWPGWRLPVAFRLWRQTHLSARPLSEEDGLGRGDAAGVGGRGVSGRRTWWATRPTTAGVISKTVAGLGLVWVERYAAMQVVYRGQRQAVRDLASRLKLKWRPKLGVRAVALSVYVPRLGEVRLVVLRHEHGNFEYLVTNARTTDLSTLVHRKRSRWRIETIFRDTKQLAGLGPASAG